MKQYTVKDLIEEDKHFEVIFVNDDAKLSEVLQLLKTKGIISCPVISRDSSNRVYGVVDVVRKKLAKQF